MRLTTSRKGLKDPVTGKSFIYKGFVLTKWIHAECQHGHHESCFGVPQDLADRHGIEFAKKNSCFCRCHGIVQEGENK